MNYQIIKLNTVWNRDPKLYGLSFVESEKDIPFSIKQIDCIYKEKNGFEEFYSYEKNWQLFFCPNGTVNIVVTDGKREETVILDDPSKGLILSPEIWRKAVWKSDNSVLCIVASEYCDSGRYISKNDNVHFQHPILNKYGKGTSIVEEKRSSSVPGNVLDVKMIEFPFIYPTTSSESDTASRSIMLQSFQDVPFEIKRFFYIFGAGNVGLVRGKHANRNSEFVLFNISGKSKVKVIDEDLSETIYELNEPKDAVYLPRMIWKEMYDFTPDSVLMVVTNEYYDPTEYIRDFGVFANEIKEKKSVWQNKKCR